MYDRQLQNKSHKINVNANAPQDIETEEDLVLVLSPPLIISISSSVRDEPEKVHFKKTLEDYLVVMVQVKVQVFVNVA